MDKQKRRYVRKFFERTNKKPEEVFDFIKEREKVIRERYSETSNLISHEYVSMILRDAIFIMELLLRNFERAKDKLLRVPADKLALKLDLVLLENQLPYFLLEEICKSIVSSPSFTEICLKFFGSLFFDRRIQADRRTGFKHFTDLLRRALVRRLPNDESGSEIIEDDEDLPPLPCATKLDESGVKFTGFSSRHLLDVNFDGGELRMPQLLVNHQTETLLRNIMALEQCLYPRDPVVCDYVKLLDSLIEEERDAQLLVDTGIISNSIGDSKALASLFNKLGAEIPLSSSIYDKACKDMKDFSQNKYNRNKAKLQRVYFGDIWKGTATIAASLFLILTFLQTITSLKQL
ncbi:UPF0481 protein At3g47200-like [Mangifera indica]|uniref:UPF0481 protein At3g47200-like n=1 Tax=Mangifera indica TaxID=29780 RepID=UPI001CFA451D|nr:UPF0481 protein At3g47200-like [Mangifera indica]